VDTLFEWSSVIIFTDNSVCKWLKVWHKASWRLARLSEFFAEFQLKLRHKARVDNVVTDEMPKLPQEDKTFLARNQTLISPQLMQTNYTMIKATQYINNEAENYYVKFNADMAKMIEESYKMIAFVAK